MTFTIDSHQQVRAQIRRIARWYQVEASPEAMREFVEQVDDAIGGLGQFPLAHRYIERLDARRVALARYPYLVWFSVEDQEVWVLAITHTSMSDRTVLRLVEGGRR